MVSIFGTNESGIIPSVLDGFTSNVTGTTFLTLLIIFIILLVLALSLRLNFEFAIVLIFPIILVVGAFSGDIMGVVGMLGLILGIILAKNFILR